MKRKAQTTASILMLLAMLVGPVFSEWTVQNASTAAAQATSRPSILVIQTDDMRKDDLAAMPKTRRLLQGGGMTFENYMAGGTPLCCPNRATALTGLYPHNHGVRRNRSPNGGHGAFLNNGNENRTIAVALRGAGYRTALLGKYMNQYPSGKRNTRRPPGWNQWYALIQDGSCRPNCRGGRDAFYYGYRLNENGKMRDYGLEPQDYLTDVLTRKALAVIRSTPRRTPLFLWVNPTAPHGPPIAAPRHQKSRVPKLQRTPAYNNVGLGKTPFIGALPRMNSRLNAYINQVSAKRRRTLKSVDDMVAKLVGAMPQGSYVFFISDNGYMLGEYHVPLGKIYPYKPTAEVPLLVRGPGIVPGSVNYTIASTIDLAPTWAAIAGTSLPWPADGINLDPLMTGRGTATARDSVLLEWFGAAGTSIAADADGEVLPASLVPPETDRSDESVGAQKRRRTNPLPPRNRGSYVPPAYVALRGATWLYIEWDGGHKEYYDHTVDPYELNNSYASLSPGRQAELAARLQVLRYCQGATCN